MSTPNKSYYRFDTLLLLIAILGIVLSGLSIRTGMRQDDDFKIFTSIVWIVLFSIYIARVVLRFKRRAS